MAIARWDEDTRKWADARVVDVPNPSSRSAAFKGYPIRPGEKVAIWSLQESPAQYVVGLDGEKLWALQA